MSPNVTISPDDELWITVGNISVRIHHGDEGAICDMYAANEPDLDEGHLAACYAFFAEAKRDDEEEEAPVEEAPDEEIDRIDEENRQHTKEEA